MSRIQCLILGAALAILFIASSAEASKTSATRINHPRPPLLKHEALAGEEEHGAAVQTAKKDSQLDPANFLVVVIAAVILVYSAHRALRPPFVDMSSGSAEAAAYDEAAQAGVCMYVCLVQSWILIWARSHLARRHCHAYGHKTVLSHVKKIKRPTFFFKNKSWYTTRR
jgi:hypothetical protein